jgi:hypothetical protein
VQVYAQTNGMNRKHPVKTRPVHGVNHRIPVTSQSGSFMFILHTGFTAWHQALPDTEIRMARRDLQRLAESPVMGCKVIEAAVENWH